MARHADFATRLRPDRFGRPLRLSAIPGGFRGSARGRGESLALL